MVGYTYYIKVLREEILWFRKSIACVGKTCNSASIPAMRKRFLVVKLCDSTKINNVKVFSSKVV